MKDLRSLISDIPDPVFIIKDGQDRKIVQTNEITFRRTGMDLVGNSFDGQVYVEKETSDGKFAYFDEEWFQLKKEPINWKDETYQKIVLKHQQGVPDINSLHSLRNMIAILLHRFRSPLTGIQGYLNLLENEISLSTPQTQKRWSKVDQGIQQLFDMMDEMQLLHDVPSKDQEAQRFEVNPEGILHQIVADLPGEDRQRVNIQGPDNPFFMQANPTSMDFIFSALIQNALEHTAKEILINILSERTITISHDGVPIPEEIAKQLFFPFVTTKADGLGIGLTIAFLYAQQLRAGILLTKNKAGEGISFSFCLPPASYM